MSTSDGNTSRENTVIGGIDIPGRRRPRLPVPLSILLFLALTLAGTYWVRKGLHERAMTWALTMGDDAMIRSLLDSWPYPIHARVEEGLDGIDQPAEGSTALHWAVRRADVELVRTCLDRGADANAQDRRGWTPLDYAAAWGTTEMVHALVDYGADLSAREPVPNDTVDWTPLHIAASGTEPEIVEALLGRGAEVNAKDTSGATPLHRGRSAEIARLLIDRGADVGAKDNAGYTPLHFVRSADIARLLIDRGADVNAKDDDGWTPFSAAGGWNPSGDNQSAEKQRILRVLLGAGAKE